MVSAVDFGSQCPGFESSFRQNFTHDFMALHCTEPLIITYHFDMTNYNVERDLNTKSSSFSAKPMLWVLIRITSQRHF